MRWQGRRESENVEDRRGFPTKGVVAGGGIVGVLAVVLTLLLGGDPRILLPQPGPQGGDGPPRQVNPAEEELKKFVSVVLADTEDVWTNLFPKEVGRAYRKTNLVLYTEQTQSGCGLADAGIGPFYCPTDEKVYIDLSFFQELKTKFAAPGDFAVAYVLAHEVGHHVQHQLGITDKVHRMKGRVSETEYNQQSVRLELQADFLAGVWAYHAQRTKNILEPGDVEEALGAAAAVGDDRLQRKARGSVNPDSFTHGTSEQRARWFRLGLKTGDMARMNELFQRRYNEL